MTFRKAIIPVKDFPANSINKQGYLLDFSEEFNGKNLDTTKWLPEYFPHSVSAESQGFKAKYYFSNGCLNLYIDKTTKPYFPESAYDDFKVCGIQTFEKNNLHPGAGTKNVTNVHAFKGYSTLFGYFEMRAKLPNCGGGGHSSWWMIGCQDDADSNDLNFKQCAEIDIIEPLFSNSNNSYPKVHPWYDDSIIEWAQIVNNYGNPGNEYHIYSIDWTQSGMKFYYDNKLIATTTNSPQYKMCMILSLYTANNMWSGIDNMIYPKTFSIDYIRVYKSINPN